MTIHTQKPVKQ